MGNNTSKLNCMFKLVSSFAVNADRKTYLIEEVTSNIECMRQQNSIIEDRTKKIVTNKAKIIKGKF